MDGKEEAGYGDAVKGDETPHSFCMAARAEGPSQPGAPTMAVAPPVNMAAPSSELKKRRGRPRKYGPDGPMAAAFSPTPISASISLSEDFSRDQFSYLAGSSFTPHVITVRAGEDIAMKIMSFSHQQPGAICVFSACGLISSVTLRQPNSSGGTLTYKGRYEIISLSGSFVPTNNGVTSRAGGISVSLAGPDGRVLGGGLAGLLVAATPVQVVLGSFLPGNHQEHQPKRQRTEPVTPVMPAIVSTVSAGGDAGQNQNFASQPPSTPTNQGSGDREADNNLPSLNSNQGSGDQEADNNVPSLNSNPGSRNQEADNNVSTEGESDDDDDDGDSASKLEISG
ncbi:hypothetical protein Cgig2_006466 [Carnegiea gigantea]|uniref:AT-hook motif nuclear-localized protein n=1 Tax=Carnegiea gigantea TaxID=171969 RepID=A0A9Q1JRU2_9CARY|nr:hypothetical protein Cgig2_006466 [Carnegiea gigantea]